MPAYEIGKSYRVPTVRVVSRGRWPIPILLPLHDDLEIIGFPYDHWNGDPRFMSDQQLIAYMEGMRMVGAPVGPESDAVSVLSFPISVRVSMKIDNPQLRAQVSASHPRYVSEKPIADAGAGGACRHGRRARRLLGCQRWRIAIRESASRTWRALVARTGTSASKGCRSTTASSNALGMACVGVCETGRLLHGQRTM